MQTNRQNLEALFESCTKRAWRLALSYLRDEHAAFDAVQQAFLVATRKVDAIPKRNPWPWFSVVVANEARNMRRKKRPLDIESEAINRQEDTRSAQSGLSKLFAEESNAALEQALHRLPDEERDAISLTTIGGMTHQSAADVLGVPRKTLSTRVQRGLEKLRSDLKRSDPDIATMLAAAPLVAPIGGMSQALGAWKAQSFQLLTSLSTQSAIAGAGAISMSKATIAAIALVALSFGFGGGMLVNSAPDSDSESSNKKSKTIVGDREEPKGERIEKPNSKHQIAKNDGQDVTVPADLSAEEASKREPESAPDNKHWKNKISKLEEERDALLAELAPFRKEKIAAYPTFTFGAGGKLEAVLKQNWKEYGLAAQAVNQAIAERRRLRSEGKPMPRSLSLAIQQNTETMRKYEFASMGKLDSAAAQNRETTHPISISNMMAAQLREAGMPLNETQVAKIEKLGEDWESRYQGLRAGYSEETPRTRKMADELRIKGEFGDDLIALLDKDQRNLIVIEETWRHAYIDLYCPTLMVIHSTYVISRNSSEEILPEIQKVLKTGYSNGRVFSWPGANLSTEQLSVCKPAFEEFFAACPNCIKPVTKNRVYTYRYSDALEFCEASAKLYEAILQIASPSEEQRKQLLASQLMFAPRIVETDKPE